MFIKACSGTEDGFNKHSFEERKGENNMRKRLLENKGISLVTLAITIVVILILASITVGMLVSDNGVVTKSKQIHNEGTALVSDAQEKISNLQNEQQQIAKGDGVNSNDSDDQTAPTANLAYTKTDKTISITVQNLSELESGVKNVQYGIAKSNQNIEEYKTMDDLTSKESLKHTFENLDPNTDYKIAVKIMDNNGKVIISEINIKTDTEGGIEGKVYEIALNPLTATEQGTTKIYEKYGENVFLDKAQTQAMTTLGNPVVLPKKQYTITYMANGGQISLDGDTNVQEVVFRFEGYYDGATQLINGNGLITLNFTNTRFRANRTLIGYFEEKSIELPTATKPGYTFRGWSTNSNATTGQTGIFNPTSNITLYAIYTANEYTVTADANGGTIPSTSNWTNAQDNKTSTKTVTFDSAYGNLPQPTREGYDFVGWTSSNIYVPDTMTISQTTHTAGSEEITFKDKTYDRILNKSKWVPNKNSTYTLVLDILENTFDTPITLKTDNRFYISQYSNNTINVGTTGTFVTTFTTREDFSNVTLGSLWFWTPNSVSGTVRVKISIYERNTQYVSADTVVKTPGDHTLTAVWQAKKYNVTFNANGGTTPTASKEVTYDSPYGLLPEPARTGYTFNGWNGKNLFDPQKFYEVGKNYNVEIDGNDIILKTIAYQERYTKTEYDFKPNTQYTLSYDWNITSSNNTIKTGLNFVYTDGTTSPKFGDSSIVHGQTGDTGHICVTSNPSKTVKYIASLGWQYTGTARLSNIQVEEGTEETDYQFCYVTAETIVKTASNHTLTARWEPNTDTAYVVNHYTHNIGNANYTLNSTDNLQGVTDSKLTINDLKKIIAGYTYEAGYTTGNTTRPTSAAETETTILPDGTRVINLYYRPNYLYVQYDMNGGSLASAHGSQYGTSGTLITSTANTESTKFLVGVYGSKVGTVTLSTYAVASNGLHNWNNSAHINIEKTGYSAKSEEEWNTRSDRTGTSYNQNDGNYNAANIATACGVDLSTGDKTVTLFVNWIPVVYTITYNLDGGTQSNPKTTYTIEDNNFTLVNPTKKGYTFLGWTGSNGNTPQTTVTINKGSTGNKTYNANWEIINYTITYNLDGGTNNANNPAGYNVETNTFTIGEPTKIGYTFTGWSGTDLTGETTKKFTINKGSVGNRTYTAHWSVNQYTIKYNSNGGTGTIADQSFNYDEQKKLSKNTFTKTGYTFSNWRRLLYSNDEEKSGSGEFMQYADLAPYFDTYGTSTTYHLELDIKSADISNYSNIRIYFQNGSSSKYGFADQDKFVTVKSDE